LVDDVVTIGNLLTVHGFGLKIEGDEANKDIIGLFFERADGARAKAEIIAVNEPRTLKAIVPGDLGSGNQYRLVIVTQSSAKSSSSLLKEPRRIQSEFTLAAH